MFVLALTGLCVSVTAGWWRFPDQGHLVLSRWRRTVLRGGLVGNTLSLALLLSFLVLSLLVKHGMPGYAYLLWAVSFLFWMAFSLGTVLCGAFGRGASRLLVMTNGTLLTLLWYLVGLASSP